MIMLLGTNVSPNCLHCIAHRSQTLHACIPEYYSITCACIPGNTQNNKLCCIDKLFCSNLVCLDATTIKVEGHLFPKASKIVQPYFQPCGFTHGVGLWNNIGTIPFFYSSLQQVVGLPGVHSTTLTLTVSPGPAADFKLQNLAKVSLPARRMARCLRPQNWKETTPLIVALDVYFEPLIATWALAWT